VSVIARNGNDVFRWTKRLRKSVIDRLRRREAYIRGASDWSLPYELRRGFMITIMSVIIKKRLILQARHARTHACAGNGNAILWRPLAVGAA
jgi:hypothetical protein